MEAVLTAHKGKGRRLSDEELNGLIDELELKPRLTLVKAFPRVDRKLLVLGIVKPW
jgi:hypothetical protein